MRIKKTQRNEYVYANGMWVRNFTKDRVKEVSINQTHSEGDIQLVMNNEMENLAKNRLSFINDESWKFPNVVIVADGHDFDAKQHLLSSLPKNVAVFGVGGALKKWKLQGKEIKASEKKGINLYIANNPYKECLDYLPKSHAYYPSCVSSTRTNSEFVNRYRGNKFLYVPTPEEKLSSFQTNNVTWHIDDYRNPICAAICIAYRFGVKRLLLFCCDNSFDSSRPSAEQLENGLWQYPQQNVCHGIIDANLHWLSRDEEVIIRDFSAGKEYVNAPYISAENIKDFFIG